MRSVLIVVLLWQSDYLRASFSLASSIRSLVQMFLNLPNYIKIGGGQEHFGLFLVDFIWNDPKTGIFFILQPVCICVQKIKCYDFHVQIIIPWFSGLESNSMNFQLFRNQYERRFHIW